MDGVRLATVDDIPAIKQIADSNKHELGFVRTSALEGAIRRDVLQWRKRVLQSADSGEGAPFQLPLGYEEVA